VRWESKARELDIYQTCIARFVAQVYLLSSIYYIIKGALKEATTFDEMV